MAVRRRSNRPTNGVWKIAYADFATAMMALFLLLWMINATSPDQKRGIADYFAPPSISKSPSGYGGMFGGEFSTKSGQKAGEGMKRIVIDAQLRPALEDQRHPSPDQGDEDGRARREARLFAAAQASLSQALSQMPDGDLLSSALVASPTPEGLMLDITPPDGVPLFAANGANAGPRLQRIMAQVTLLLEQLPNQVMIIGHAAIGENQPWELSSARAQAAFTLLRRGGVASSRFQGLIGKGTAELVSEQAPDDPGNRRISLLLLPASSPVPISHSLN